MNSVAHNELWCRFAATYSLSDKQLSQFQAYAQLLQHASLNVTSLRTLSDIIQYHFFDALEARSLLDWKHIASFIDVGSGGGIPGIPLKIMAPHAAVILLEVIGKKRDFLQNVVQELGLDNVSIDGRDWRTFLRGTPSVSLDVVCSRAALPPQELVRMFQPSCPYRTIPLVYWASESWQPSMHERVYTQQEHKYMLGDRCRRLILFSGSPL